MIHIRVRSFSFCLGFVLATLLLSACGESRPIWREQKLPSGRVVKVTQCILTWGVEHDERTPEQDSFSLEFVYSSAATSDALREQEAKEAFELIRPISELWALKQAAVAGFPTTTRKGKYDLWVFDRAADGRWTGKHYARKVFVND